MAEEKSIGRRTFITRWIAGIIGWGTVIACFIPTYFYLLPATKKKGGNLFTDVEGKSVSPERVKQEGSVLGMAMGKPAIAIFHEGKIKVLSAVCTHLGCIVKWFPGERILFCPCHAGKFDARGKVLAGPPPAPLRVFQVKEEEDRILLS
ncbi:MAG: QcrA and Rieske domain-containing protein [bacterium JZ-2024 1]